MIMHKILMIVFNCPYHISLIYLHVIDIIQKPEIFRINSFHKLYSPCRAVALVVDMIYSAVEKLHTHSYLVFFSYGKNLFDTFHTVFPSCLIINTSTASAETDDLFISFLLHQRNVFRVIFYQLRMKFFVVESVNEVNFSTIAHGRVQTVLL